MFHAQIVEKIKTHILCSMTCFENRVVYETMWQNMVEPDRQHKNMAHAHCMPDTQG
jgi:hypothetical protein